jgi:hypothetical protein
MGLKQALAAILVIHSVFGNIMDNIFGNYNAPNIYIARDFELLLGVSREASPY